MKRATRSCWTFILMFVVTYHTHAQIAIANLEKIPELKNGTTYIVMNDPAYPGANEYIEMFKANWTISNVAFIKYADIEKYYKAGNFFLTIGGYITTGQTSPMFGGSIGGPDGNGTGTGIEPVYTQLYLELWTCKEKYLENTKYKYLTTNNRYQLARIDLYTTYEAITTPKLIYREEYNVTSNIRNWGVGILKNYVQVLMTGLSTNPKERWLYSPSLDQTELSKLKSETLYVPDYVLIQIDKHFGTITTNHLESDMFSKYKLKYKLLPTKELNTKIMTDKEPFYYLVYVKSCTDKFISVVNSQTGEIVYSKYYPLSYNIKPEDLDNLQKQILGQ
jgi:hypothetical protein